MADGADFVFAHAALKALDDIKARAEAKLHRNPHARRVAKVRAEVVDEVRRLARAEELDLLDDVLKVLRRRGWGEGGSCSSRLPCRRRKKGEKENERREGGRRERKRGVVWVHQQ